MEGFFMTRTIKEITEKLNNVDIGEDTPLFQKVNDAIESKLYSPKQLKDMMKQAMAERDLLKEKKTEEIVLSFSDDSDDLATAFAALITCIIKQNLIGKKQNYKHFLCEATERIIPNDLEDAEKLKQFLKGLSVGICDNNYDQIQELYYNHNYSITAVYLFCYYMSSYCINENEKSFENLKNIYHKMNDDMLDYVLGLGNYKFERDQPNVHDYLFPFCFFGSYKEHFADRILLSWTFIASALDISSEKGIELDEFLILMENLRENAENLILSKDSVTDSISDNEEIFDDILQKISVNINLLTLGFRWMTNNLGKLSQKDTALATWNDEMIWHSSKIEEDDDASIEQKLHIPTILPNLNYLKKLLETNIALEKAQEEKKEIIDDFSHRYKNMKATSLHDVANSLLEMESETLKKHGRTILLEYGIKESLRKEVDILKLYFEDNIEELKKRIQDSIVPKSSKECYSIYDIINNSIKKCMITLVYDGDDEPKAIRAICFKDYDLISILNSFEKDILFKENVDVIRWFSENIAKLDVGISDYWKQIFCKKYSHSDNILSDLLVELIMNNFKYADKKQPITIELTDDDNFIIIKSENTLVKDKTNIPSHKNGIKTQNKLLNVLNRTEHKVDDSITYSEKDGKFSIEIKLSKKMFEIKKDEEDDEYADMV